MSVRADEMGEGLPLSVRSSRSEFDFVDEIDTTNAL